MNSEAQIEQRRRDAGAGIIGILCRCDTVLLRLGICSVAPAGVTSLLRTLLNSGRCSSPPTLDKAGTSFRTAGGR